MQRIQSIASGSLFQRAGIKPGESLLSIDSNPVDDVLDFLYLTSEPQFTLEILDCKGERREVFVERSFDDDLGVTFEKAIMDDPKSCQNRCIFCFIDQLPKGLRESLYFKDDDSRLSFLQGNFVTLTNMTGRQIQKIVAYGISPINVSVHTTDPSLRMAMLGNKRAGRILDQLRLLTEGGIEVNAQIVLCPGVNDGQALTDTLKDLERLGENLRSVAVVPLGKTRFREGLAQIPDVDQQVARETIKRITAWWEGLLESRGSRWVFAADEFYLKAQWEVPKTHCYEGFTLLEDGVGLLRFFSSKMTQVLDKKLSLTGKYTVATGKAAESFLIEQFGRLTELHLGLEIQVVGIENHFFGEKITVSGLVVGRDLMDQLMGGPPLGTLLIPSAMLRDNTEVFLDDVTLNDLKEHLQCDVVKVPVDPEALVAIIERRKNHG